MEEMLKSGVHFGYSTTTLNPKMKPFIFTSRGNAEIFDLEKIINQLNSAKEFLKSLGAEKKTVLFSGTKKEIKEIIKNTAQKLDMPYVNERWLGGTITNFKEIKNRIDYLNDLAQKKEKGELEKYTKKERLQIERKIIKLNRYLEGIKRCQNLMSALIVVDPNYEKTAVREAKKNKIPVIAIMNSDCNPEEVDYPIPANDSSISSVGFLLGELAGAYKEGYDNSGTN